MEYIFMPLSTWPDKPTPAGRRQRSNFKAPWSGTIEVLERELRHLGAKSIVIEAYCDESEIRNDGMLRANAKLLGPGIVLSFKSKHGPLRYPCDTFTHWQDNVRGIALALESLRRVDRYGVTKNAEQYRGWKALPGGEPEAPAFASVEDAAEFMSASSGYKHSVDDILYGGKLDNSYRLGSMKHHPDREGDGKVFIKLQQAKEMIESGGG